jgi:tRNA (mo5U34)-methyltransferase
MKAGDQRVTEETRRQIEQLQALGYYHSIELPDGQVIRGLQTPEQLNARARQFPIPADLTGKRVLDIGAWDGWFSFEMEKRGASVVAVDAVRSEKLLAAREMLGSKVEYVVRSVYDLRPEDLGRFDIVLFLGVLYHLKHPMLALERVCALASDLVCVESYVTDDGGDPARKPAMEFYETTELCGQFDNWVGPNTACLLAMCRTAGFVRVKLESVLDNRAHVTCHRKWEAGAGTPPAPYIVSVERDAGDDYVSVWFKTAHSGLSAGDVFLEFDEYAAAPALLYPTGGDGWQAVVRMPPGIGPGRHELQLRVRDSAQSNTVRIGVDESGGEAPGAPPAAAIELGIEIAADGKTWERNVVHARQDGCISLWVRGIPEGCRVVDVKVLLRGESLPCLFLSETDPAGLRQVNALLPPASAHGSAEVRVAAGGAVSSPVTVEILEG